MKQILIYVMIVVALITGHAFAQTSSSSQNGCASLTPMSASWYAAGCDASTSSSGTTSSTPSNCSTLRQYSAEWYAAKCDAQSAPASTTQSPQQSCASFPPMSASWYAAGCDSASSGSSTQPTSSTTTNSTSPSNCSTLTPLSASWYAAGCNQSNPPAQQSCASLTPLSASWYAAGCQTGQATPQSTTPLVFPGTTGSGGLSTGVLNGSVPQSSSTAASPQSGSADLAQCSTIKFLSLLDILIWVKCIIVVAIIPLIFAAALMFFLWGVAKFIAASDSAKKEEGKKFIIAGLIGLFVMTSLWGIIKILGTTLGVNSSTVPVLQTDYLKK